jgi:hypothetical protein
VIKNYIRGIITPRVFGRKVDRTPKTDVSSILTQRVLQCKQLLHVKTIGRVDHPGVLLFDQRKLVPNSGMSHLIAKSY